MQSFTDFEVWKVGMELMIGVYELTKSFPREEIYGLTSQMKRASTSILANFAEGCGRHTFSDKAHKFTIARGESTELEAFLRMAVALKFCTANQINALLQLNSRVGRLISGLIIAVKKLS